MTNVEAHDELARLTAATGFFLQAKEFEWKAAIVLNDPKHVQKAREAVTAAMEAKMDAEERLLKWQVLNALGDRKS